MATNPKQAFSNVEPFTGWIKPDLTILRQGVPTPKFPRTLLGDLAPLVDDLAVAGGTSFDFVAMSLLALSASVIGSKRRLQPDRASDWTPPAVLWVGLVAPPSGGKTPAIRPLSTILSKMQTEYLEDHKEALRDWQATNEMAKAEQKLWEESVAKAAKDGAGTPPMPVTAVAPKQPVPRRFFVNDTTVEALQVILSGNPQGVAVIADELGGWFASFDRYSCNNRDFWLQAYNGQPYITDRKGSPEPLVLPFLGVSVLGGIQPGRLPEAFRNSHDGLHSRLMWVWPEPVPYARPHRLPDVAKLEMVFRKLDALVWGTDDRLQQAPITLGVDDRADAIYQAFAKATTEEINHSAETLLSAAVGKMRGQLCALALTVEHLKWALGNGSEPREISGETMEACCAFLSDYLRPMAEKVYGDAALPEHDRRLMQLARWLMRHKPPRFNSAHDILRQRAQFGFKSKDELRPILEALLEAGWIKFAGSRDGDTKGRQSSDYLVNPAILEAA